MSALREKRIIKDEWGDEIEQLAQECGIAACDLRTLAMLGIHGAHLLRCRMLILRVDPDRYSNFEPANFRELQRNCSACTNHRRCALDLKHDLTDPTRADWQDYCPNVAMLKMLSSLESCGASWT
jgi:hypothetical protein